MDIDPKLNRRILYLNFETFAVRKDNVEDNLDSSVQLHGWTMERKLTTGTLVV